MASLPRSAYVLHTGQYSPDGNWYAVSGAVTFPDVGNTLARNLFFVTRGQADNNVQALINYMTSPDQRAAITTAGFFSIYDYKQN